MTQLIPCSDCHRHVNADETECPFCKAELDFSDAPAPALPRTRLGRAATFAFGATLIGAALVTGCGGDDDDDEDGNAGAPAAGASTGGSTTGGTGGTSAGTGTGARAGTGATAGAMALYGAPPSPGQEG